VPSSTNLDKNMAKLSIGWSSSTDLHENLYRLFTCRANALCRKQISTAEKDYRVAWKGRFRRQMCSLF
jgi:hypothetical protein